LDVAQPERPASTAQTTREARNPLLFFNGNRRVEASAFFTTQVSTAIIRCGFPRRPVSRSFSRAFSGHKHKERRRIDRPRPTSIQKRPKDGLLTACAGASNQTFALCTLACQLANAANGFSLFASALLGGLFVIITHLHFTENAFALHLFLQGAERLINVIVAD